MPEDDFDRAEQALQTGGAEAALQFLSDKFRNEKNYAALFETRLMRKRRELGLPLLQMGSLDDIPEDKRPGYEKEFIEAARETGNLFLGDGDIPRGYSYLRAIGDLQPVYDAIDRLATDDVNDAVLEIALHERVHPRKGFELVMASHGICRAITVFGQYPGTQGREDCLHLLIAKLHADLIASLRRTIEQTEGEQAEGAAPAGQSIPELIAGRDWLFEGMSYYVDTSHLVSILGFSLDLTDPAMLRMAIELCEYGRKLSPMFHYRGDPPFEDIYADHAVFLKALLGEDVEAGIAHFVKKVEDTDPEDIGTGPAQILVVLLGRLKRYKQAVEISVKYLAGADQAQLACPSVLQLCYLAEDPEKMMEIAKRKQDLLGFTAGLLS
jgi:hypothetical protein